MRILSFLACTFLFIFPIYAQNGKDVGSVTSSTMSRSENRGTGLYVHGSFQVLDKDKTTTKAFRFNLYEPNLIVNVGVEYGDFATASKRKPTEIKLAIAVSDKEQDAFASIDNAVAGANYSRKWGRLYVQKEVTAGDLVYTFTFTCNDGTKTKRK